MYDSNQILIFDADGVVIEPWWFARELQSNYGITPDLTRRFFTEGFKACLVGKADLAAQLAPHMAQWGWMGSVDELIKLWNQAEDKPRTKLLDHIQRLRRRGITCCLASNQSHERADYIEHVMGFDALFDHLYFSCRLGAAKPDCKFFEAITTSLGCAPQRVRFWDDTVAHVDGALECGWHATHFTSDTSIEIN